VLIGLMITTPNSKRRRQRGAALVISIMTLMLISVVATALILMAGTQAAIKTNYKSAMQAFYDAKAGLEEGRGRLWPYNPNAITNCVFPTQGSPMPIGQVCYIVNPSAGEVVDPTNLDPANPYADNEYQQEWQIPVTAAPGLQPLINSTSASGGVAGPQYKWVRITPRTEFSANTDVDGINGLDNANPLFFDGTQQLLSAGGAVPNAAQVLTLTALAVTPYGSRRMVQYTIAQALPGGLNMNLNAAPLMLVGANPIYQPPSSTSFQVNGNDRSGFFAGTCALPQQSAPTAVGLSADPTSIINSITALRRQSNYQAPGGSTPSVTDVTSLLPPSELDPPTLDALVQSITAAATVVINGPANGLPSYGSPSQPVIAVVQASSPNGTDGNLTLNNVTGYGILVVTGQLTLVGKAGWRGIVLVIGQGDLDGTGTVRGNEIDGTLIVADTRDGSGNVVNSFGTAAVNWTGGHGGFFYDSCWINNAMASFPYKVLSFREIAQTQ
jgi:hypothetical protein